MRVVPLASLAVALLLAPAVSAAPRTGVLAGQVAWEAPVMRCGRARCLEPAAGVVLTVLRDGLRVALPQTDASGRFRLSLLPGRYAIRHPRLARDRVVVVAAGGSSKVQLRLRTRGAAEPAG